MSLLKVLSYVKYSIVWNDIVSIKSTWTRRLRGEIDAITILSSIRFHAALMHGGVIVSHTAMQRRAHNINYKQCT